jgi:hypothetical protein
MATQPMTKKTPVTTANKRIRDGILLKYSLADLGSLKRINPEATIQKKPANRRKDPPPAQPVRPQSSHISIGRGSALLNT